MSIPKASPNRNPAEAQRAKNMKYFCFFVTARIAVTTSPVSAGRRCCCLETAGMSMNSAFHLRGYNSSPCSFTADATTIFTCPSPKSRAHLKSITYEEVVSHAIGKSATRTRSRFFAASCMGSVTSLPNCKLSPWVCVYSLPRLTRHTPIRQGPRPARFPLRVVLILENFAE